MPCDVSAKAACYEKKAPMMATGNSIDLNSALNSMSPSPFDRGFIQTVMDSRPSSKGHSQNDT